MVYYIYTNHYCNIKCAYIAIYIRARLNSSCQEALKSEVFAWCSGFFLFFFFFLFFYRSARAAEKRVFYSPLLVEQFAWWDSKIIQGGGCRVYRPQARNPSRDIYRLWRNRNARPRRAKNAPAHHQLAHTSAVLLSKGTNRAFFFFLFYSPEVYFFFVFFLFLVSWSPRVKLNVISVYNPSSGGWYNIRRLLYSRREAHENI